MVAMRESSLACVGSPCVILERTMDFRRNSMMKPTSFARSLGAGHAEGCLNNCALLCCSLGGFPYDPEMVDIEILVPYSVQSGLSRGVVD